MRLEYLLSRRMDRPPFLGETEAGASPLAQPKAEPLLQSRHLAGNRGCADVQVDLRRRKSSVRHHGEKHPQQLDVCLV